MIAVHSVQANLVGDVLTSADLHLETKNITWNDQCELSALKVMLTQTRCPLKPCTATPLKKRYCLLLSLTARPWMSREAALLRSAGFSTGLLARLLPLRPLSCAIRGHSLTSDV